MANIPRLAIVVTVVNLVLLVILLSHDRAAAAQSDSVLNDRTRRALEMEEE